MPIIIMIVQDRRGCRIIPAHTPARTGDTVRFSAINTAVDINFPGPIQLFTPPPNQFHINENQHVEVQINKEIPYGTYPFSAFCLECNTFAEGGSFGELIVGP
jgi:hypothetical protein